MQLTINFGLLAAPLNKKVTYKQNNCIRQYDKVIPATQSVEAKPQSVLTVKPIAETDVTNNNRANSSIKLTT